MTCPDCILQLLGLDDHFIESNHMQRKFLVQMAARCLAACSMSLGLVAQAYDDDVERNTSHPTGGGRTTDDTGSNLQADARPGRAGGGGIGGGRFGGGRGTIHAPARGGVGRSAGPVRGHIPAGNRNPSFSAPRSLPRSGPAAPVARQPSARPQLGTGGGRLEMNRPTTPRADVVRPNGVRPDGARPNVDRPSIGRPNGVRANTDRPDRGVGGGINSPRTNVGINNNLNVRGGNRADFDRAGIRGVGIANQSLGGNSISIGNRNVNLAASGYRPAYQNHPGYHGYWNGHYGGNNWGYGLAYGLGYNTGYNYGNNNSYNNRVGYYRPLGWGLGAWGLGSLAYNSGYLGYSNPYYNGYAGYNYAQPIQVVYTSPTDGIVSTADEALNAAAAAFQQSDFDRALDLVNQGIAQAPGDAVLHEFRALVLFAKADYQQAASTIHSVLAVGPGWNWTTLIGFYSDAEAYTAQLRSLEGTVRSQPEDSAGRFLLAYHYITAGHADAAARQLQQVVARQPADRVAADLLKMISSADTPSPSEPVPSAAAEAAAKGNSVDPATLVGAWSAARDDGSKFALTLSKDATFTWNYSQKGRPPQELTGKYTLEADVLALEGSDGGSLVARITPEADKQFNFKLLGAPEEDPGLTFAQ